MRANQCIREVEVKFKRKPKKEEKVKVRSSAEAVKLFKELEKETQEKFIALHLDIRQNVSCFQTVFIGTSIASICDPKPILRTALLTNSCGLILIHNHPSGDPRPAKEDIEVKSNLSQTCKLLNIKLLDFIIIGDAGAYFSCADQGTLS